MTHAMLKGANVPLDATAVRAVLHWSPGQGVSAVDASALLLAADGRVRSDEDFVFYNQPRHPDGKVWRLGQKRVADGMTDTIQADLSGVPAEITRILVTASTDPDATPFENVRSLRLSLYDAGAEAAEPIAYFDIKPETGAETALICGELYRRGDGWRLRAVGEGYSDGLVGLATDFGISVDESAEPEGEPGTEPEAETAPVARPSFAPAPAAEPAPPLAAPGPMPEAAPVAAASFPLPPQQPPSYGYPPAAATQQQPPAYGYPQPVSAWPDPAFKLPPQGPQFIGQ
ncbi:MULTISPECIES: TerD family protein [unclassified Streptomyces]|uniref:TerD family protein n=1 Tax=unclassified Streptomyces TaxID=2593676 RepID=UPI003BB7D0B0